MTTDSAARDGTYRPLVVRFGAMGDQVMLLGLIEALHRRFCTPVDVVSSGPWTRPVLEAGPAPVHLYLIRSRRTPYVLSPMQWQLVRALRTRAPGPVWLCDPEAEARSLLRRSGIAEEWLIDAASACPRLPGEHTMNRWLRFAQMSPEALPRMAPADAAAIVQGIVSPPLRVLPAWRAELDAWLPALGIADRPLILLQVGNKRTMRWWVTHRRPGNTKYWPEDRWARLVQWLLSHQPEAAVLLLGVPVEAPINDLIVRLAPSDRLFNVARQMTLPRLLALQERALGMVSVDTGPAHSAAALDCPLVVLFGKGDVQSVAPRSPSGTVEVLTGRQDGETSIGYISVEDVQDAWTRLRLRVGPALRERPAGGSA
jgi:heptosyltransferase-2/heptosyltransferase-3